MAKGDSRHTRHSASTMNASFLTPYIFNTMNTTADYILSNAARLPQLNPNVTFYTAWGVLFLVGLLEVARLASTETETKEQPPVAWAYVGDHPGLKTPTPVYRKEYTTGKASYRWRKSDKSPWTYGSNPADYAY